MEKTIKLVMNPDKSIQIKSNGDIKHIILENERKITAQTLYDILDYTPGDNFNVIAVNENKIDEQALDFFKDMLNSICARINSMPIDQMTIKDEDSK